MGISRVGLGPGFSMHHLLLPTDPWSLGAACMLGSLVLCQASGRSLSLLRPCTPIGSNKPGCCPSFLSVYLFFWGLTGFTQSWGTEVIVRGSAAPTRLRPGSFSSSPVSPVQQMARGQMGPHLGQLAEPMSESKQFVKYCSNHRSAGIHRRLESTILLGQGGLGLDQRVQAESRQGEGKKQGILE